MKTSTKQMRMTEIDAAYQSNNCSQYIPPCKTSSKIILRMEWADRQTFNKDLARVMNMVEAAHIRKQVRRVTQLFDFRKCGYSSISAEMIASSWTNWNRNIELIESMKALASGPRYFVRTQLSSPRKNSIMKKMIAQNCGNGNIPIASGYVMNAKDGPPVATDETGKPVTSVFGDRVLQIALLNERNYNFESRNRTHATWTPAQRTQRNRRKCSSNNLWSAQGWHHWGPFKMYSLKMLIQKVPLTWMQRHTVCYYCGNYCNWPYWQCHPNLRVPRND